MRNPDSNKNESPSVDPALPIQALRLSVRLKNLLARDGVVTLGELLAMSDTELLQIRTFGVGMLAEVADLRESVSRGHLLELVVELDTVPSVEVDGRRVREQRVTEVVLSVLAERAGTKFRASEVGSLVAESSEIKYTESAIRSALETLAEDADRDVRKVGGNRFAYLPDGMTLTVVMPERVVGMVDMRRKGKTLQEIASVYGVTRERVRQLLVKYGGPSPDEVRAEREETRSQADAARAQEVESNIRGWLDVHGMATAAEIAENHGYSESEVRAHWPAGLRPLLLRAGRGSAARWTDEQVMSAIRMAGTFEFPLRMSTYDELVRLGEVDGPGSMRITQRFGTWTEACGLAGVEAPVPVRTDYQSLWTDSDLLEIVCEYLASGDSSGTYDGFEQWCRSRSGSPSSQTVRNRFGSWTEIKLRASGWLDERAGGADG